MPVVVGGESRRRGRDTVMSADDGGEGLSGFKVPTMPVHKPVLQDHVPGQGVRYLAPLKRIHRLVDQPCLLHAVIQSRDLDGEGRGALADVQDPGNPGGEQAALLHPAQSRVGVLELALNEFADGGRQPVSAEVLGHRRGVEQMQPEGEPVVTLGVIAEFGPCGSGLRRERHKGLLRWRVEPNGIPDGPRH